MNIYKPMTHDEAKIVYGLLRTGAYDHARDFITFIEEKQVSDEQASRDTHAKRTEEEQ